VHVQSNNIACAAAALLLYCCTAVGRVLLVQHIEDVGSILSALRAARYRHLDRKGFRSLMYDTLGNRAMVSGGLRPEVLGHWLVWGALGSGDSCVTHWETGPWGLVGFCCNLVRRMGFGWVLLQVPRVELGVQVTHV
jgi:hypothetical protein